MTSKITNIVSRDRRRNILTRFQLNSTWSLTSYSPGYHIFMNCKKKSAMYKSFKRFIFYHIHIQFLISSRSRMLV